MTVNAEPLVIAELNRVKGVGFASADVPATRPKAFVTVERVGGPRELHLDHPRLAVQCWSDTRHKASELASEVAEIIREMVVHPNVGRVAISSIYNFPDPSSGSARYQMTVEIVTHG
ncbi:hypothetical protein [Timonella senegalensis]|uniref:hypothetical protein n=1 Tax=Timonella senegalensis TaxID=1465825 RepID=UPI0002E538EE|nr:hypothetical protein [Timonella senegalensis]